FDMYDVVRDLLTIEDDLVATVTCPLDRQRPNNEEDRIKLRNLQSEAQRQLAASTIPSSKKVAAHLDEAFASIVPQGGDGVVVVATKDSSQAHILPFPVRAAVSLATTPATRYLVQ